VRSPSGAALPENELTADCSYLHLFDGGGEICVARKRTIRCPQLAQTNSSRTPLPVVTHSTRDSVVCGSMRVGSPTRAKHGKQRPSFLRLNSCRTSMARLRSAGCRVYGYAMGFLTAGEATVTGNPSINVYFALLFDASAFVLL
jgi:hypothetical protein